MIHDHLLPLANHIWQSSLLAAAVWLFTLMLRKNRAAVRHRLWLAASIKFLIPFSLLVGVGNLLPGHRAPVVSPHSLPRVLEFAGPFQGEPPAIRSSPAPAPPRNYFWPLLDVVWAVGFAGSLLYWFVRGRELHRMAKAGTTLALGAPVRAVICRGSVEPGVFGVLGPVLLLPEGIAEFLSPPQFEAMLAHELCHVRRRDNLTAAIHMLVEALFWFHPLVWWIGHRLVEEQERACDEAVLLCGRDPHVYAESILKVCSYCVASPLKCATGISGADLKKRIRDIVRNQTAHELSLGRKALLAAAVAAAVGVPTAIGFQGGAPSETSTQKFDVTSVRLSAPSDTPAGSLASDRFPACGGYRMEVDAGRFSASHITLYKLITWAYGIRYSCYIVNDAGLLSGGPKWVLTGRFNVEATIPPGLPAYTPQQLYDGAAPELQAMLRNLLADRFQLILRRGKKEMPVYTLSLSAGGPKLPPADADKPKRETMRLGQNEDHENLVHLLGNKASMADLAHLLEPVTAVPVLDQTGLAATYRFDLRFAVIDTSGGTINNIRWAAGPSVFSVLQQLGLKLAATRTAADVWVIDSAEQPPAN